MVFKDWCDGAKMHSERERVRGKAREKKVERDESEQEG